ncbi:MAG TPA: biotin/lipoyl-containing protein, partial [Methylophilaceae bacterium]|nr:biotin/lipoyl-containing protein [Methylophilaceae bacterium]
MSKLVEVVVPDIGNFDSVDVIEVLVEPGDIVAKEDSLITLESDKASMDIPSSHSGTVKELKVKVGDKVAKGTLILLLEEEAGSTTSAQTAPATQATKPQPASEAATSIATAPVASQSGQKGDIHAEVVVLGSGPGGYTAA